MIMTWVAFGLGLLALIIDCINCGIALSEEDEEKLARNEALALMMLGCIIWSVLRIGGIV